MGLLWVQEGESWPGPSGCRGSPSIPVPSSGTQVTRSQVPCRSEGMLGQSPRPPPTTGPCQAPQGSWYREMPITGAAKKPRSLQPLGLRDPAPQKSCPAGRQGLGCPPNHPFLLLPSTLPDSPPDSGSEAYSPQQVNGESSGHRPPPLGFGQVAGAALSGGRGPAAAQQAQIIAGQILPGAGCCSPWAAGEPGPASEQVSLPGMPPACPPAPSWTRPSAVSGRLGEAGCSLDTGLAAAGPPPLGRCSGVQWPPGGQEQRDHGQPSPHSPERGQEFCLSYQKHLWNASWGTKGAGASPLRLGGWPLGPAGGRRAPRRTALGVPETPS